MDLNFIIGGGLLLWVLYDFFQGTTWTYRKIYRAYEPVLYWIVFLIWLGIALATLWSSSFVWD
ncbi:hypothetical protein B7P33_10785 [Sediminicola luteus]|uniref:Uncharacterized protein n=1 Tax=Sediminicola luteus TaxID=319238 RepID=A0A2A4G7N2_9FLAO|nr:hypothetical protein B7P33_10785 [Sediminicola luteus]